MAHRNTHISIGILSILVMLSVGCSAEDSNTLASGGSNSDTAPVVLAETELFAHDVVAANAIYAEQLRQDPTNGTLAAGKAVTDLMLLPYSAEVGALLTENLGAARPLSTRNDLLYRTEGLLDLLSRGVSFQDDGALSGIETLLEDDLPWQRDRLESTQTFVDGLDRPVNSLMDNLVAVADALETTYLDLDVALRDASFGAYYIPGTVFFDDELSLQLGRTEVAFLRAGVAGVRSVIYFAAAYDWSWSLEEAFGSRWDLVAANPEDPDFVEGWAYDDYATSYLGDRLAREVRDASNLSKSRDSARDMLLNVRAGIEFGINRVETNEPDRTLTFSNADLLEARDIVDFIQALENALFAPTRLPFTEPDTTLDLSSFFEDGRTLAAEQVWFERVITTDEFGQFVEWRLRDRAYELYFVEGVFSPEFSANGGPALEFGDATGETTFVDDVSGELTRDVESTYGTR